MDYLKKIMILLAVIGSGLLLAACSFGNLTSNGKITIRELCEYNEGDTPFELHYSYVGDELESKDVTISDEDIIKQTLAVILDTEVMKQGCQVDMYVHKNATYEYVYDGHTIRFSFIPYSYFSYDGKYYEIAESELSSLSRLFDDIETENSDTPSSAANNIPEIETEFIDNGDEARSDSPVYNS